MEKNIKMMNNKSFMIKMLSAIFIYIYATSATSIQQDITLNNPTSLPIDI